jgi:hypothetical protein
VLPSGGFIKSTASYTVLTSSSFNQAYFVDPTRAIGFELVRLQGQTISIPFMAAIAEGSYASCTACLRLFEGCSNAAALVCSRRFLAQQGTVSFGVADAVSSSGRFSGSARDVVFKEWDFAADVQVSGGRCYRLPMVAFDAAWP